MSADEISICPKCHPKVQGVPGVTDNEFSGELSNSMRGNYEFYILDGNKVVADYRANCWDCGYEFSFVHIEPMTGLT